MDVIQVVLTTVLVILATVLTVVGVQVILVLNEVRKTVRKVNLTVDVAEQKINKILNPFQSLGSVGTSLQTGFRIFESFIGWLDRDKNKK